MHNSNYLFTFFSNIELIIFAIIIFYFILKKEYEKVRIFGILSIGIIAMFFLWELLISLLPYRPRPFVSWDFIPLIPHDPNTSFPSSHAFFFGLTTIFLMIPLMNPFQKWAILVGGMLMCLSRVIAGLHYPSDIFFGVIFGFFSAFLLLRPIFYKILYS